MKDVFIHPTAEVSARAKIGSGTKVWNYAQVRENSKIGKDCIISKSSYIDFGVVLGDRVKVQNFVSVYHGVRVEDDVFLGPSMTFTNDMFPRAENSDFEVYPTHVKKGASIGANSTIVCGVTRGEYSMVGAVSVVTEDVPDNALVYGNPAKVAGFICSCGRKLEDKEDAAGSMICPGCKKEFTIKLEVYAILTK